MKIAFAGDLFLGGDLKNAVTKSVIRHEDFLKADKRVVNLEQPISDNSCVSDKCTLYTGSEAIRQLLDMQIDGVNLAHNHIQDKGVEGIRETIMHLDNAFIGHFGAGSDLDKARTPFWLTEDIAILGYCEFAKPYLKQIVIADQNSAGVAPLRIDCIEADLASLPDGKKAILYFHWGREHVWLPPYADIEIAKKLLEHEKVLMIVGGHPHRPQGVVEHNGKKAYMCIGNFLFPNFYIAPPVQLTYLDTVDLDVKWKTRRYHAVLKTTYKKWKLVNRTSLIVTFDTSTGKSNFSVSIQMDNDPAVIQPKYFYEWVVRRFINILSFVYRLPQPIYIVLEKLNSSLFYLYWRIANKIFLTRQYLTGA